MQLRAIALWPQRLIMRVLLFNSALIVISALVFFGIGIYTVKNAYLETPFYILSTLCSRWDDPASMQTLGRLIGDMHLPTRVAMYTADHALLLSTGSPPLPPLSDMQFTELKREEKIFFRLDGSLFAMRVMRHGVCAGYGLASPPALFSLEAFLLSVLLICLVIVFFSVYFALSLALPIGRLSSAAQAFGRGDFTARANISRSDELGSLGKAFDDMAGRVNGLLRSQKELLASVSHELRTPLSRIRVALDIAAENNQKEDWSDMLHDLEELEQLIADILMATRLDLDPDKPGSAALPLRCSQIDTGPFLRSIADRFCALHSSHRLTFSLQGLLPTISADPRLLRRVVENILDNARKYSNPGSAITMSARQGDAELRVEISDTGIGIAEADLEHVFKPFFRADRSRTRATGGVGLGLMLSKRIITAHGGRITITSRLHSGTTVCFSIPVSRPPAPPASS